MHAEHTEKENESMKTEVPETITNQLIFSRAQFPKNDHLNQLSAK